MIVRDPRLVRGGALLMSIALAVGAAGCSAAPSVDRIEYEGEPSAPQEVTRVSEVAWEWEAPEESLLRRVLAGSAGALMVLGDGVVALDGATGDELWHYRVPDASVASAGTTPDGSTIVVAYEGEEALDVVVLDAGTGELLGEYESQESADAGWAHYLTDEVRVSHHGALGVSTESLETGEQVWEFAWEPPEGTSDLTQGSVSLTPDAVIVSGVHDSVDASGQGDDVARVMVVVGLDPGTGEPVWERELPFAADEVESPEHTVSAGGEVLLLEAASDAAEAQWLLDPSTGEDVEGSAFPAAPDRDRVVLLDDGYVDREVVADENEVRYRHMAFDGAEQGTAVGEVRPGETSISPGTATDEGLLRLDFLSDPDLDRGPVSAEFLEWGGQGPAFTVDIDLAANEELLLNTEGSMTTEADAPTLVAVPGAVVVTEATEMSKKVVGLA